VGNIVNRGTTRRSRDHRGIRPQRKKKRRNRYALTSHSTTRLKKGNDERLKVHIKLLRIEKGCSEGEDIPSIPCLEEEDWLLSVFKGKKCA